MKTAFLLEELIQIADMSKKDFASACFLSPSGLSRLLSGQQILDLNEHKSFSSKAARALTSNIYGLHCYQKLSKLFPFIYDFASENGLHTFLEHAISTALLSDYIANAGISDDSFGRESVYLNHRNVLNMSCILLSSCFEAAPDKKLELYSSLPLFDGELPYSLSRIIFTPPSAECVTLNQAVNSESFSYALNELNVGNPIGQIHQLESSLDLYFWETAPIQDHFILVKDQLLLIFDTLPDETPAVKVISNKYYLLRFAQFLEEHWGRKLSFNKEEVQQMLDNDPAYLLNFLDREPAALYAYEPIGFFLKAHEMSAVEPSAERRELLADFFQALMTSGLAFYPAASSITEFVRSGRTVVPFSGNLNVEKTKRVEMMRRFEEVVGRNSIEKTQVFYSSMSDSAILCLKDLTLLYLYKPKQASEKLHLFFVEDMADFLKQDYRKKQFRFQEFSQERWQSYIEEISRDSD
ncbi:MAG: hypothetical protein PHU38_04810 [Eubacteriales bacterium]|nr:hypothetical protein [Eubacteriales bacterium]